MGPGEQADHINHDGLDNRKINLRRCTTAENNCNARKSSTSQSQFRGVCRHRSGKWFARIFAGGQRYYLGMFHTEMEAAEARDFSALQLHGSFAMLNTDRRNGGKAR